jgi:hypothetical protein
MLKNFSGPLFTYFHNKLEYLLDCAWKACYKHLQTFKFFNIVPWSRKSKNNFLRGQNKLERLHIEILFSLV